MRKFKPMLMGIAIVITLVILWNAFSQPGLDDFNSTFKEIHLSRNENNTGPVDRVYIVTTSDTLFSEMELYGKLMPYSKQGTTKVYFFHENNPFPKAGKRGRVNFDERFEEYCLARYFKNSYGAVSFSVFPFQP
ncbi:hypothetical protein [Roseivirga misakiensis]|uniref:Uncharacterized protein n=1 Tax=Roseivirga misakiensis TaxID=1563681 RepID=A0A1E5T3V2_9BACT|nr:hypothetical protein [Roseivirga misakiensis]OEK05947.1 hypothetical protein BFP71_07495 [Roseivirga misakiensis]